MTALATARLDEIEKTAGLGGGVAILTVSRAGVEATATRVLRAPDQPVKRFRAPRDARDLVRRVRATLETQVIYGLDDRSPAFWEAIDRHRDTLIRGKSLLFVLSSAAAGAFTRYAPNLASVAGRMVALDPKEDAEGAAAAAAAQAEFTRLSEEWERDTAHHSSLTRIVRHPAYQRIIAMGDRAIGPILRDLETTHRPWGPALHAITHASPVAAEDAGKASRIAAAWLRWAEAEGYVW
jgi:hypothetical protein